MSARCVALFVFAVSTACGGPIGVTTPSSASDPGPRHLVPNGLPNVTLEDFDKVAFVDADLHEAVQTRRAIDVELERTQKLPEHRRWFFYAFDRNHLDFVVARYFPTGKKGGRYVAEHRLRVRRTGDAEHALLVADTVRQQELGDRGVKVGMARRQVEAKLGRASREQALGSAGAFDMLYPSLCVRFVDNRVAHVWQRARCSQR